MHKKIIDFLQNIHVWYIQRSLKQPFERIENAMTIEKKIYINLKKINFFINFFPQQDKLIKIYFVRVTHYIHGYT